MTRSFVTGAIAFAGLLAAAAPSSAQLFDHYAIVKDRVFFQTTSAPPAMASEHYVKYELASGMATLTPENVGAASVQRPDGSLQSINEFIAAGVFVTAFSGLLPSEAAQEATAPGGTYTFNISGGAFGSQAGTLVHPSVSPWPAAPHVINYAVLTSAEAGRNLVLDISDHVVSMLPDPAPPLDYRSIAFLVVRLGDNSLVADGAWFPDSRDISISGSQLTPGPHRLNLSYAITIGEPSTAFGGTNRYSIYVSTTIIDFTVVEPACSPDYNAIGGVSVQDIFDFLFDWNRATTGQPALIGNPDYNHSGGTSVQDIFDFLADWSAGCP
jgi:hypothetical protein